MVYAAIDRDVLFADIRLEKLSSFSHYETDTRSFVLVANAVHKG